MNPVKHNGAVLIMCLLMLSSLSLLGLSAASEHLMQLHMSHNLDAALERRIIANGALDWAEGWLMSRSGLERPAPCLSSCAAIDIVRAQGAYGPEPQFRDLEWWQQNGHASGSDPETGARIATTGTGQAWWIIEELHVQPLADPDAMVRETAFYRITARGMTAGSTRYQVTESILARPWGHESLSDAFPSDPALGSLCTSVRTLTACNRQAWRWLKQ